MKIKSSFKDYYDFVANMYGGGDPSIIYVRKSITEPKRSSLSNLAYDDLNIAIDARIDIIDSTDRRYFSRRNSDTNSYMTLVIAGRSFHLINSDPFADKNPNSYRLITLEETKDFDRVSKDMVKETYLPFNSRPIDTSLLNLSKKVGAPVFCINKIEHIYSPKSWDYHAVINGICPVLSSIGLPSIVPAQEMYQEIAYFMGNLMKDPPDTKPPIELSNKEKIKKAGFDLVTSFRHRK